MTPEQVRIIIRQELESLIKSDRYVLEKNLQIMDGRNVQLGLTTGTKIGTSTSQKLGFLGVTPIIRQGIPAPYTAADIGTALIAFGLLYQT